MPTARFSFLWKLYAGLAGPIVGAAILAAVFGARSAAEDARKALAEELRGLAALLGEAARPALAGPGDPGLEERVRTLGRELRTRLTVIAADGRVLADSDEDPARMENHADRPEIREARSSGAGRSARHSHTVNAPLLYVAVWVDGPEGPRGYARAALPLARVEARLARARRTIAGGVAGAATVALILGFFFARRVTRPLAAMAKAAALLAEGRPAPALPLDARDEIGDLARALDAMARELARRIETIEGDRNRLAAILAGMAEGVVAVDGNQRVLHLNAAAGRLLGVDPAAAPGRPFFELARFPEASAVLEEALRGEAGARREARLPGSPRDRAIALAAAFLPDAQGRPAGAVLVLNDVTEIRRLEAVRRDFVANVSHELKTPLTAVRGLVETLLDDPAIDAEKRRRYLERVRDQSARLSAIVTDLLALSRLESAPEGLAREPFDLRDAAREAAAAARPAAEAKSIALETDLPGAPLPVRGDREALRQVLDNLLDNAVKYTGAGGRARISLRPEGARALIEVADTGIGIEAVHLDRIFERFFRVDKARSRELGGTGLGLSIVRHCVLAHGGEVWVESEPGRGSVFRVLLPLGEDRSS